ncbi:uncharacterized protein E0L32_002069 [Thyridium curvatum]|uniref:Uncharacterized protein n=1 Tax=Thyridium curvatum TaxID=1093900 RepID=A0A507ALT7_9PEZI|nr:uncharacterized protein E0L32_002064 [Thyridium curvatum]XP_030989177.1 uncharacterized protein E0L32_002069 [Thyridium curvatum]TPX07461.1 hypothetical protein E0L32_002064 [Thyridium curvatum]TPX07466.1 hypothetical protein E0L32_002069 [Thyridium curvatum]
MAEAVAGAVVAEQIVSTGVEVGAAAAVARPTQPLKATLQKIATIAAQDTSLALARSHHTLTVIGKRAHLLGGKNPDGQLCAADVHSLSLSPEDPGPPYACYPSLPAEDGSAGETLAPSPRWGHAAARRDRFLVVHGGANAGGRSIAEDACLWLWDTETYGWTQIKPSSKDGPQAVHGHYIFVDERADVLYLHGGTNASGATWKFDFKASSWSILPPSPEQPAAAAFVDGVLYSIGMETGVHGYVHFMRIEEADKEAPWTNIYFPINPIAPGPTARPGGVLLPMGTGFGRKYLVYLPGRHKDATTQVPAAEAAREPAHSDIWTLQIFPEPYSAANLKDVVRDNLPGSFDSGLFDWAEVEVVPAEEETACQGKAHPGPRGFFGADAFPAETSAVLWGGLNEKGETESDGWVLRFK